MLRTRVVPCLLLKDGGLVKTVRFTNPAYVGDPVNAVRIFNEKEVDELVVLDISASPQGRAPDLGRIREIASECFMPVAYGGGIRSVTEMRQVLQAGVEKVVVNSLAIQEPRVISDGVRELGSSSVVVSMDVKRKLLGRYEVYADGGRKATGLDPINWAQQMEGAGAGEIFLNSIDRDGTRQGFDLDLIRRVSDSVRIPVIACGGAGSIQHLGLAVTHGHASAVSAASMFVFHGKHRAVLISYPSQAELAEVLR